MSDQALGKSWKPIKIRLDNGQAVVVGYTRKPEWQLGSHEECADCKRLEKVYVPIVAAWKSSHLKRK